MQQPSVGRIVHWQPFNSPKPLAAVIVDVDDDLVNLAVYQRDGMTITPKRNVAYSETPEEGHWNWPPRT